MSVRRYRPKAVSTVTMSRAEADALDAVVKAARDVVSGRRQEGGGRLVLEVHLIRLEKALAALGTDHATHGGAP